MNRSELIIDSFAGGGGASLGIEWACGRSPDVAVNHNPHAIAMHTANHPTTRHYKEDVFRVNPREVTRGRPVGLLWLSPDCKHFSRAKGGKPVEKRIRGLAWVAIKWAVEAAPRVIVLENVREFCFPSRTAVLTKRGVVPIGEIEVGDEVWTHNARWKPVTVISRRRSPTVRVIGYGNSIIESTPEHRFYARQYAPRITKSGKFGRHEARLLEPEWVRADRLADVDPTSAYTRQYSGYAWASPSELPRYWMRLPAALGVDCSAEAFFYMLGRWLGDGWVNRRKSRVDQDIVRICANLPEADELERRLAETGLRWTRHRHTDNVDVFDLDVASSRILIPWLKRHFGEYADGKTLPAWVYGASEVQRWAMIDGYGDADGHEHNENEVQFVSVSRCLAVGMRLLLQSLGVPAHLSSRPAGEQPRVGDAERTMRCREAYSVSWRRETKWEKCHRSELHLWGPVRSVEPAVADAEVVDITVADDHSFIADGQVVHNCDWGPLVSRWVCGAGCGWKGTESQTTLLRSRRRCPRCESLRVRPTEDMVPCPDRKGLTFRRFVGRLKGCGYAVDWKVLNAADFGAPTHRRRLFLVARNDGEPIRWPEPTHADPKKIDGNNLFGDDRLPWRTAAECIDWSITCPSIFERKKPLADKTLRRIALGIKRYVLDNPRPFIVEMHRENKPRDPDSPLGTVTTQGNKFNLVTPVITPVTHAGERRANSPEEPLPTVTGANRGELSVIAPTLVRQFGGSDAAAVDAPLGTVVAGGMGKSLLVTPFFTHRYTELPGRQARGSAANAPAAPITPTANGAMLVSAFIAKHFTGVVGVPPDVPLPTVTAIDHNAVVSANLVHLNHGEKTVSGLDEPARTVTAGGTHAALVYSFLTKYFGNDTHGQGVDHPLHTATAKARFGLVTVSVDGVDYVITDIGMRMLKPRELARAQGFPDSYLLTGTATQQVERIGNSVCPPVAKSVVRAQGFTPAGRKTRKVKAGGAR